MAVDVVSDIVIDRPLQEVAPYAADPDTAPVWYDNIASVEWRTPPPLQVGSRLAFVARFLGRRIAYTYEVVDLVPGERLVMRTAEGPMAMETTYTWQPVGMGSTRMSLRNRGGPKVFAALPSSLLTAVMRRANQNDLAKLKAILENRAP